MTTACRCFGSTVLKIASTDVRRPDSCVVQIAPPECGIFLVVADLNGSKDTVKMLACLNKCFPHAKVKTKGG